MLITPQRPLTGGLMVIIIPSRKGRTHLGEFQQDKTQKLIHLSADVMNRWSLTPTPAENGKLTMDYHKRVEWHLNLHFLNDVEQMQIRPERCSWSFKHNLS